MFLLCWFMGTVVHECGHLVAGRLGGMRLNYIRFGPLTIHSSFKLSWNWMVPLSGVTSMLAVVGSGRLERRTILLMCAGGPLASFVSSAVALGLQSAWTGSSLLLSTYAVASFVIGVITITPHWSSLGDSDGKRIWALLTHRERAARMLALYELMTALETVDDYNDLPADLIERVTTFNDDSVDTVMAHAVAYCIGFYGPDVSRTAGHLETCLAASARCAGITREALICDAAVFQARKKRRADLAREWLNDLPAKPRMPDLRLRIGAALLEAEGDPGGALAKLSEIEAILQKVSNPWQRQISLRLLARWRADISVSEEVRTVSV
jgi:hypothetical protein